MARYTIEGVDYPSVTQILDILDKPALKQWAVNMACNYIKDNVKSGDFDATEIKDLADQAKKEWKNLSQEAMSIGSEVHSLIEKYIKDGRDAVGEMRPEVENAFLAFLDWEKENIDKWLASEMTVYDPTIGYAGTLDAIAKMKKNVTFNGLIYVLDFKASKGFYDGYGMQLSGYRGAVQRELDYSIDGQGIVRLDKETGLPEFKDYSKVYEAKLSAFYKLTDYYYAAAKRRLKNNPRVMA